MPAKDLFHDLVKKALETDGWIITADPLHLRLSGVLDMYIDLGAQKVIAAEKDEKKIAVEIKTFIGSSTIYEFHLALGQFFNYCYALEEVEPERILYLAVPLSVYEEFFNQKFIQTVVRKSQLNLIIFNAETEKIVQWKP